jgi:hypothetical protein
LFKASSEDIAVQQARAREEFLEEREEDEKRAKTIEAQRKRRKTKGDRQRKREQRTCDKQKDIRIGKRDAHGKLKHTKVGVPVLVDRAV